MQLQHLLDKSVEVRQQLQYFADATSFTEEVPVRLLDRDRLGQLPPTLQPKAKRAP